MGQEDINIQFTISDGKIFRKTGSQGVAHGWYHLPILEAPYQNSCPKGNAEREHWQEYHKMRLSDELLRSVKGQSNPMNDLSS